MPDVFLSYAREDEKAAKSIAELLTRVGWSVFWDRSIPLGQEWRTFIDDAIESARCVVVLWSEHSVVSRWVVDEAEEGIRRGILVPVLIRQARVPRGFRQYQYADLTDGDLSLSSPRMQALVGEIRRIFDPRSTAQADLRAGSGSPLERATGSRNTADAAPTGPTAIARGAVIPLLRKPLNRSDGSPWTLEDWTHAEQRYRDGVLSQLRKTRLIGSGREVDLESLFTDVHFVPEASASKRFGSGLGALSDFQGMVERRRADRFNAMDALKAHSRLYVLGTPGAGKSTFLRHVAVMAAGRRITGFPLFVALKDWSDSGQDFMNFAAQSLAAFGQGGEARAVLAAILESPDCLLLLDGLDEVPEAGNARQRVIRAIEEQSRRHPGMKILLTCRTAANEHLFQDFRYVEVADFLQEQQKCFVEKWYVDDPRRAAQFLESFRDPSNHALRDLGRKPLMLAFLCLAFDQTLEFPSSKSALYAEAIDVLLVRWDANRSIQREMYGLVGPQRKKMFLAQLAYRAFELDRYGMSTMLIDAVLRRFLQRLPGGDQLQDIDASVLARSFESAHGILVERAAGVFSFAHLSIHEYFAGVGLANAVAAGGSWGELLPEDAIYSARWHEILLHAGAAVQDGESFLSFIRKCIGGMVKPNPTLTLLLLRTSHVADTVDVFDEFSRGGLRYLKTHSEFKEGYLQDFSMSSKIDAALSRLERSLLYCLRQYREAQKESPLSLLSAWRRFEVLREVLINRQGVALMVGMIPNTEGLEISLHRYIDAQDLYLKLTDEVMVVNRDKDRLNLLGVAW
jgi:hypothetical protein